MHHPELIVFSTTLITLRFFLARGIARLGFAVYELAMCMIPSGHPVRIYSVNRMKEARERALPLMRHRA